MKVAVLKGGTSLEREVSLRSAARVEDAVGALGHEALGIDVGRQLVARLRDERPDVVFIALHGPGGEDGTVQELLEILDLPYTGPGVAACALCMDKVAAKHEMRAAGIPTPDWAAFNATAFQQLGAADTLEEIEALLAAFSYDDRVLLERYVKGRELAVGVIRSEALPIVEAIPREEDFFNFEARYEIGRTEYVCPAELGGDQTDRVQELATRTYEALGCSGFARVDLMLGEDDPEVLEVNAIPGLTDTSLFPMAAEAAGIDFTALVERILASARDRPASEATLPA